MTLIFRNSLSTTDVQFNAILLNKYYGCEGRHYAAITALTAGWAKKDVKLALRNGIIVY
jgi:hypothetical protein